MNADEQQIVLLSLSFVKALSYWGSSNFLHKYGLIPILQSSWKKQAVEVDSSPAMSPIAQVADSTCAQVIRPISENSGNKRLDIAVREGCEQSQPGNQMYIYLFMVLS